MTAVTTGKENYVLACDKDSVYLSRDKPNHLFLIEFKAMNPKICIDTLFTFDIFKMLYELNKDVLDAFHIAFPDPADPSRAEIIYIFKSILGLGERYTHVYTHMPHLSTAFQEQSADQGQVIYISSRNVPKNDPSQIRHLIPKRAEQIDSDNSLFTVHIHPDKHVIHFYYKFNLKLTKPGDIISVPPFVDKAVSLMMKTMFVRMKQFIEILG